jgi:hypothetical protein
MGYQEHQQLLQVCRYESLWAVIDIGAQTHNEVKKPSSTNAASKSGFHI